MRRPSDVPGNGDHEQHEHSEREFADGGLETTNGGTNSQHCATSPDLGVSAGASVAASGGEQDEILSKMRDACERRDCSTKEIGDATLLRFLRARSMTVDKAATMFVEHQKWRASYIPLGYVLESECPRELASNKLYLQGRSKVGWAVAICFGRNHDAMHRDLDELKRLIIYFLDKAIASAAPEAQKLMIIIDLKGITYKNLDARAFITGFGFLQSYYPERLAKVLMINSPVLFVGTWKIINRFLDGETRSKIAFVGPDRVKEICLSNIDTDVLPTLYGGKADLKLLQDVVVPNWPPV